MGAADEAFVRLRFEAIDTHIGIIQAHPDRPVLGCKQPQLAGKIERYLLLEPERSWVVRQVENARAVDELSLVDSYFERLLGAKPVPALATFVTNTSCEILAIL